MSSTFVVGVSVAIAAIGTVWVQRRWINPKQLPYPPGPPPLPLIGNLLDMPQAYYWLTYAEMGKKYGDLVYMKVLDKHILVVNSVETARNLLERRSSVYSDRPRMPMIVEL